MRAESYAPIRRRWVAPMNVASPPPKSHKAAGSGTGVWTTRPLKPAASCGVSVNDRMADMVTQGCPQVSWPLALNVVVPVPLRIEKSEPISTFFEIGLPFEKRSYEVNRLPPGTTGCTVAPLLKPSVSVIPNSA